MPLKPSSLSLALVSLSKSTTTPQADATVGAPPSIEFATANSHYLRRSRLGNVCFGMMTILSERITAQGRALLKKGGARWCYDLGFARLMPKLSEFRNYEVRKTRTTQTGTEEPEQRSRLEHERPPTMEGRP